MAETEEERKTRELEEAKDMQLRIVPTDPKEVVRRMRSFGLERTYSTTWRGAIRLLEKYADLEGAAQTAHDHLINLQPHIAQLEPNQRPFIDADVDEAIKVLRGVLNTDE